MNLTAYSQIEDLMPVLQSTGIEIPRLRGLSLMKNEEPVNQTDLNEILHSMEILAVQNLLESFPAWDFYSCCSELCPATDRRIKKYMILDEDGDPISIRWDRIHGKKRKTAKYAIKQYKKLSLTISKSSTNTQVETIYSSFTPVLVETTGITSMVHPL